MSLSASKIDYLSYHIANILSDCTSCLETGGDAGNTNQHSKEWEKAEVIKR